MGLHRQLNGMNAINWQKRSFPNVQYRYLFYYEDAIFSPKVLDFRNETTWPMQEDGREQAKKVLQMGEGTGFKALEDWEADPEGMEEKWGSFKDYYHSFMPEF